MTKIVRKRSKKDIRGFVKKLKNIYFGDARPKICSSYEVRMVWGDAGWMWV